MGSHEKNVDKRNDELISLIEEDMSLNEEICI